MTSGKKTKVKFFGILNVTPDSFSDGGQYFDAEDAIEHTKTLIREGASYIDIGADSTRPGSVCVGPDEEWRRIKDVITAAAPVCNVSVDTHHSSVAKLALDAGAQVINDISSGGDPKMFEVVASSNAKIIMTYTRCVKAHEFANEPSGDIIENIKAFFGERINQAIQCGIRPEQIVLDPGMGAFISAGPDDSWNLLGRLAELREFSFPFMLSLSRKGFMKSANEVSIEQRDMPSAYLGALAAQLEEFKVDYLRVHDVNLHRELFSLLGI